MRNEKGQFVKGHKSWLGKKRPPFSKEWRENMRKVRIGQHNSPKTEFKKGQNVGEKGSAWKGGITPFNNIQRRKFNIEIRDLVFKRDNYTCQLCGKSGIELQVDHIQPVVGPEGFTTWDAYIDQLFCDESNLQVLCLDCHKSKTLIEKGERDKNRSS